MDFWEAMSQPAVFWYSEDDDSDEIEALKRQNQELRRQNEQLKELLLELKEKKRYMIRA